MVRLIQSFNKYGRPESLYDLFWSPVWVLYSVLWLPNRCRRTTAAEQLLPNNRRRAAAAARLPPKRGRRYLPPHLPPHPEPLLPNRYHRNPLPHPAAVASSRRTAAAELRLLHGYQRSVAAATYHRTYRRTPNRCHRTGGYSFRPLMASRSLVSISSASSGLSSRTLFTPSRPWASLLSL